MLTSGAALRGSTSSLVDLKTLSSIHDTFGYDAEESLVLFRSNFPIKVLPQDMYTFGLDWAQKLAVLLWGDLILSNW